MEPKKKVIENLKDPKYSLIINKQLAMCMKV